MAGTLAREAASLGSAGTVHQSTKVWPLQCGGLTTVRPLMWQLTMPRRAHWAVVEAASVLRLGPD